MEKGIPPSVINYYIEVIGKKLQALGNTELTSDQIKLLIEAQKEGAKFSIFPPKLKRFKLDPTKICNEWAKITPDEQISHASMEVHDKQTMLSFQINKEDFVKRTLQQVYHLKELYGYNETLKGKKIIVEYSSPNIAKPFHAGHLRSTIIGNFMAKLFKACSADVLSFNYLGDWGKQYGVLAVGYEKYGNDAELERAPIQHLFDIYVKINADIEKDPSIDDLARHYFKRMEEGEEKSLALWKRFRDLSIKEYQKTYDRLGVKFDVISGESEMTNGMLKQIAKLTEMGLLQDDKGALVFDLKKYKLGVPLIKKKDGATLYITRDIAAAVERKEKYNFDKMYYVVASQQDLHFKQLFKMLELMKYPWAKDLVHINFGMVRGLSKEEDEDETEEKSGATSQTEKKKSESFSTRKGNVIFLADILAKAKSHMHLKMHEDNEDKLKEIKNQDLTADHIGLSAVFIQDFHSKRIKDYTFMWERCTSFEGHTGPYLQYAHARLCSMEDKTSEIPLTDQVNFSLLTEASAIDLAVCIAKFPDVIVQCAKDNCLEPCTLATYLFELSHLISLGHAVLWVKGQKPDIASVRKLLFWSARVTLGNGLRILGIHPVERM
eukprot:TRINITY_DN674_c0_g1_i6.p1 TRINITY_DN674_c0_g1~~TRINITY_DN674_c0_g1_i6.p1  ORF type:complete len:607 (-),score=106.12 TRINITY_DN674_c0_g1_i6:40-1860(-)